MSTALTRPALTAVVQQHADDAAQLRVVRRVAVRAPHMRMLNLLRLDERITAHLDALSVAGSAGGALSVAALASPGVGELFAAGSWAIQARDLAALDRLVAVAGSLDDARAGLVSAFGWVSRSSLSGIAKMLLESPEALRRQVGLAACAVHRVDPGAALDAAVTDPDGALRACALKTAGQCGRADLLAACLRALADEDERCRNEAASAALLLGDRGRSLDAAIRAETPEQWPGPGLSLLLMVVSPGRAAEVLKRLSGSNMRRELIRGVGLSGDSQYVPWLLAQMGDPGFARLAGESFTLITGVDLADGEMEDEAPEGQAATPNDNPEDEDVGLDPDDNLPWPHRTKIEEWWRAHGDRFPRGSRSFMGAPVTQDHCAGILKTGRQRQRVIAAHHLSLLNPGAPLFNTSAPAQRQRRLLAQMS